MPDRPDPVLKSGPKFVKSRKSSPQENTATIFAANTITIVSSSFAHPSASTEVQLRFLENGAPKPVPLNRFYKWLLVGLIVFAGLCVIRPSSADPIGLVAGLFTGKQL